MSFGGGMNKSDSKSSAASFYDPTQTGIVNNYAMGVAAKAADPNSDLSYKPYTGAGLSFGNTAGALANLTNYQAPAAVASTYSANKIDPASVADVHAGQIAGTNLQPYENPYNSDVINATVAQMARQKNIDDTGLAGQATAAHAFGGSRSAVLQNLNDESYQRATGQTVAGLNQANFAQAQAAAGQDIGTKLQADITNQAKGLTIGQSNQAADNAAGQFNAGAQTQVSLANQGADQASAAQRLQAIGVSAEQAQAMFGADWAKYVNSQQTPEAIQALVNQAMGLVPSSPLQQSQSTANSFGFNFQSGAK